MLAKDRFWQKVRSDGSGCFVWRAATNPGGYGLFRFKGGSRLAHRVSWELIHGAIPDGMCVCHRCDNRVCVNPEHLWLGTYFDNVTDMIKKGRDRKAVGSDNGKTSLTAKEVIAIRADSRRHVDIGVDYGLHPSSVSRIKSGQRWVHV